MNKCVLVKPLWNNELGGKLFQIAYPWEFHVLRQASEREGIILQSWDMVPLEKADCIWFLELPERRADYESARRRVRNGVPFILQIMETPTARSQSFCIKNHACFDYIASYQQHLRQSDHLFIYRLPNCFERLLGVHKPFQNRKCAVMINTNRIEGWFATRKSGPTGLPGLGPIFSGWHRPWWAHINPARGELYSWRRKLARLAETRASNILEIHGKGWNGERISWIPLFNRRPYKNRASGGDLDKLELIPNFRFTIGVENFRGRLDYISEKIFEPMMAGSVPVYLGEEKIHEVVPSEAFVDVRNFKTQVDLLNYLEHCPESEWQKMYDAGQAFLASEKALEFSRDAFVSKMLEMLKVVLRNSHVVDR